MLLDDWIPDHSNVENVVKVLRDEKDSWMVLTDDRPLAIFKLHLHEKQAKLQGFCLLDDGTRSLQGTISVLRNEIFEMGAIEVRVEVPKSVSEPFVLNGFEKSRDLVRVSGRPFAMKMMPILRLSNVTKSAIPDLSKVLYQAYEGSSEKKYPSVKTAELALQEIIGGQHGRYASDASFLSGSPLNTVSASLITLGEGNMASVVELFTHPLYRARGFATTELAAGMNWLVQNKVDVLTAWVPNSNDVARRLFAKIGFKEDKQVVELVARDNSSRSSNPTG